MSKYINLNAAIRILWELSMPLCDYESGVKQLESLPTIESNEDAISRKGIKIRLGKRFSDDPRRIMEIVKETVDDAPSVIPKPKEGEWLACTKEGLILNELARSLAEKWYGYKCSECGYIHKGNALRDFKFCPNCGAKMKGAER